MPKMEQFSINMVIVLNTALYQGALINAFFSSGK